MMSVRAQRADGRQIRWADLASARPGSQLHAEMVSWADRVRAFRAPVFFAFHHEPEALINLPNGTAADYLAAWRAVRGVFRARAVTNARFMWIMTAHSFGLEPTDRRRAEKWYPGDAAVDAIASDAYNWHNCRPGVVNEWKSLATIIEPMRRFGLAHPRIPLHLAEWASTEDPAVPGRKAGWIDAAHRLFQQPGYAQFRGLAYFNVPGKSEFTCSWEVTSSPSALAAFARMGRNPRFGGTG